MAQTTTAQPMLGLIEQILYEHSKVKALYEQYKTAELPEEKEVLAYEMVRDICIHSAKEEMVLYPAIRAVMGDEHADQCLAEHQQTKEDMAKLDSLAEANMKGGIEGKPREEFEKMVTKIMDELLAHIEHEEKECLPTFRAAVNDEAYLQTLGMEYHSAAAAAPTRPHPEAPNQPPANFEQNPKLLAGDLQKDLARFGGTAHTTIAV